MSINSSDLHVWQGSKQNYPLTIADNTGKLDLTSYDIILHIKENPGSVDVIILSSTVITEIEKLNQNSNKGEAIIFFIPALTDSVTARRYIYSIWIEHQSDAEDKRPIMSGYFYIDAVGPSVVSVIRNMLDEAGELGIRQMKDEIVSPTTTNMVYAPRTRIKDVQGVFLLTDTTHSMVNYYTGGSFNELNGQIILGSLLPNAITDIRVDYTWESGINESTIYQHVENARKWANMITGESFEYGATTTNEEYATEQLAIAVSIVACVLTINGANVAQYGYNFKIQEFEIQTKLWGEGMIAQALFAEYRALIDRQLQAIGIDIRSSIAYSNFPRYDLNRHFSHSGKYDKWSNSEASE